MDRPVDPHIESLARIAWCYHMIDMSQQEIADAFGLPRLKVLRLLKEAKERGLVEIRVSASHAARFDLEERLAAALDLDRVMVVPSGDNPFASVAYGLNELFGKALASRASIGIGAGRTIAHFARVFEPPGKITAESVVSLTGNTKANMAVDLRDISNVLAAKLDIDYFNIWAPAWCPTAGEARAMRRHPSIRGVLERASRVDCAFVGVGSMESSMYLRYGYLDPAAVADMKRSGLAGEVLGHFFDMRGTRGRHAGKGCSVSVDLPLACPVTAVCCGVEKAVPVIGARRAGFIDGLVADEALALELLRLLADA